MTLEKFEVKSLENQEQARFRPELLSFDELLVLARRIQERLEIYRDIEGLDEVLEKNDGLDRGKLEATVEKVEMILSQVNRKIDILKSLKVFYQLYESWAYLIEEKNVASYDEFLNEEYKKISNIPALAKEDVPGMADLIEAQAARQELPKTIEEIAESPEAELVETSVLEEKKLEEESEIKFADLYKAPEAVVNDFAFEENRLEENISYLENTLEGLRGRWGKKKEQLRLESKLAKQNSRLDLLRREKLAKTLENFFDSRRVAVEEYLLNLVKHRDRKSVYRLYSSYEKLGESRSLPENLQKKLITQGLWGKILAEGGNLNEAIDFFLMGSSLGSLGPSSILTTAEYPADVLLNTVSNGSNNYPLFKVASEDWAKAHDWEEALSVDKMEEMDVQELLQYLSHYEAKSLLDAKKLTNDEYYQSVVKIFRRKFNQKREDQMSKFDLLMDKFKMENQELNPELYDALSKGRKTEARYKAEGSLFALFIADAGLKNILEKLYLNDRAEQAETITQLFVEEGVDLKKIETASIFDDSENLLEEVKEDIEGADAVNRIDKGRLNKQEDSFEKKHPLLSAHQALMDVVDDKLKIVFDIDRNGSGHFKTVRAALRICALDTFPREKIEDKDGFSAVDAARLERAVTVLDRLLQSKDYGDWDHLSLKGIAKIKNHHLLIEDYESLEDLFNELFDFNGQMTKAEKDIFVKIAQSQKEEFWMKNLKDKLLS